MRWYLPTGDGLVPVSDPAVQFAAHHLGGRTMPDDLRRLLELQWHDAASGTVNRLKSAGVIFLEHDGLPALIESECKGRNNLEGITRLAYAQAMADMIRYSGFVAEDVDGSAIGYWFGPDRVPIEVAPLMYFDTTGDFSVLRGDGIAEAVLVIASHGNDRALSDLRDYLNEHGLRIRLRRSAIELVVQRSAAKQTKKCLSRRRDVPAQAFRRRKRRRVGISKGRK